MELDGVLKAPPRGDYGRYVFLQIVMESFGFSAPYKVLDEKLGFTGENVYKQVKALLA